MLYIWNKSVYQENHKTAMFKPKLENFVNYACHQPVAMATKISQTYFILLNLLPSKF